MLAEVIIHHIFFNQVCNNNAMALDARMHQLKMAAAASRIGTFFAELTGIGGECEREQRFIFQMLFDLACDFFVLRFCF